MNVLIVSDTGNRLYWNTLSAESAGEEITAQIMLDTEVPQYGFHQNYDFILLDVSDIEDLHRLIPEIHNMQPWTRIIVLSNLPTWKETRELIRLGAASLIRKRTNPDEIMEELQMLQTFTHH